MSYVHIVLLSGRQRKSRIHARCSALPLHFLRQRFGNIGIYFWPVRDFGGVLLPHFQFHHHGMYLIVIEFPNFEILRHRATFTRAFTPSARQFTSKIHLSSSYKKDSQGANLTQPTAQGLLRPAAPCFISERLRSRRARQTRPLAPRKGRFR